MPGRLVNSERMRLASALAAAVPLGAGGCVHAPEVASPTTRAAARSVDPFEMQALVMSMADDYIASLSEAMYLLTRTDDRSPRARWLAQSYLRNGVGASLDIAAGPNPPVALLDLLAVAALQTWSFERHWMPAGIGDGGPRALARLQRAEAELWAKARTMLDDEQLETLRDLVNAWIAENPDRTVVALVRFDEFADERKISSLSLRGRAAGLLREVGEATGAIDDARLMGERALWYSNRFLYLVGQQAELTAYRIADQPEGRKALETLAAMEQASAAATDRLRSLPADLAAERDTLVAQIADERQRAIDQAQAALSEAAREALADAGTRLAAERTAALEELFGRIAAERTLLLDDLESRQDELRGIMTELRDTIQASGSLAGELTGTVNAIDRVVSRFDAEPGEEREPLDMKDVRDAAAEAKLAAQELTRLLERTDRLVASEAWDRRVASLVDPLNVVVDRAFRRGAVLLALLVVGLGLMLLVVGLVLRRQFVNPGRVAAIS